MDLCEKFISWCSWNGCKVGLYTLEMQFCKEIKYGRIQVEFSTLKYNENLYRVFWIYSKGRFQTVSDIWILDVTLRDRICGKLSLQRCRALSTGKQLPAFRRVVTFILIYCMEQIPSEKLTGSHLIKKFPAFYGTRRFITTFTSVWDLSLSWTDECSPRPSSHFLNIHFNIILPLRPGPSKLPFSLRFPHQHPVHTPHLLHKCYMSRPSHSS